MANTYKRFISTDLSSATTTTVMTVPTATTTLLKSAIVSNNSGSSNNITMSFSPSGSSEVTLVPSFALASNNYIDLLASAGPVVLEELYELKFEASAASADVVLSVLSIDRE